MLLLLDYCLETSGSMKGSEVKDALLGQVRGGAALRYTCYSHDSNTGC